MQRLQSVQCTEKLEWCNRCTFEGLERGENVCVKFMLEFLYEFDKSGTE
jgi:hypothetical protein